MKKRNDLQANAVQQLEESITTALSAIYSGQSIDGTKVFNDLVNVGYVSITPPLEEPPMMQLLTIDSLKNYKEGSSIKPGNIRLNIRKLIESIPDIVSVSTGIALDNLIVTLCGAFSLWLKLKDIATVSISKEQAFVIVALWKGCNTAHKISLDDGFIATNNLLNRYGEADISYMKYNILIDSLIEMRCIELTESIIWLREWISKGYIHSV